MSKKLSLSKETLQVLTEAQAIQGAMPPTTTRVNVAPFGSALPTGCYLRCGGTLPLSLDGGDCFRTRE